MQSLSTFKILTIVTLGLLGSACSQRFAVSINNQTIYDPRSADESHHFADVGLQACVNFALQQPDSALTELTILACPGWEIEAIDGIGALTALQFLDLSNNALGSIAPLTELTRLSSVTLINNRISDIAPLISMTTLTSAAMTGNNNVLCSQLEELGAKLGENLSRPQSCRN